MDDAQKYVQLKHLINLALGGAGVGMFGRGLLHMAGGRKPSTAIPFVSPGPSVLPVPVPQEEEEQPLPKLASDLASWVKDNIGMPLARMIPDGPDPLSKTIGEYVSDPRRAPIMYPLSIGAGAAGVAGGWSLTDWLLKRRRKARMQEDITNAKRDFQNALLQQAQAARGYGMKTASELTVADKLEMLFDAVEEKRTDLVKQAAQDKEAKGNAADLLATAPGLYYTALALLTGGAAYGTYNWTRNRSPQHLLNQAVRERSRALWAKSPQAVQVVPTPMSTKQEEEPITVG